MADVADVADVGVAGAPRASRENPQQVLASGIALAAFRLNGQLLAVAEELSRPAGLTAARWQVLGAVLQTPLPVAGIARAMGITRQSVQRVADLLVDQGLAEYRPNPAHRRAKLVATTDAGYAAVERIGPGHAAMAAGLVEQMGMDDLAQALDVLHRLSAAFEVVASDS